ncbi:MAG: hypothetical protein R3F14_23880 [Polyangiaceae bacterium]
MLKALLGNDVKGHVELSREGLSPVVIAQGDRESAALDTLKVLAFDLTALSRKVRGARALSRVPAARRAAGGGPRSGGV